jgi:hypothetical protein
MKFHLLFYSIVPYLLMLEEGMMVKTSTSPRTAKVAGDQVAQSGQSPALWAAGGKHPAASSVESWLHNSSRARPFQKSAVDESI